MRTRYKTQCPRCHTIYPMPDSKLDQPKARANCGKCHHTFFLNLHIIHPEEVLTKSNPTATSVNQKSNQPTNPPAKKADTVIADDTLFDDNTPTDDTEDITVSFDGLDDFLHQEIQISSEPTTAATKATTPDGLEDEAWLDDLLKDNGPKINTVAINNKPKDDLSDIIGTDFASVIPAVAATEKMDKATILKKVQARIDGHAPSQEQLAKKRSPFGYIGWLVACIAMVALMAVQYSFFNLQTIIKTPEKAAMLQSVCDIVGCQLPQANISAFSTEYQLADGRADFTTNLIGILKNTSASNQLYPNLKVRIEGHGQLLGEFIATPADYLTSEQHQIAPTQDRHFMLTIVDISKNEISAIAIEPFY